MGGSFFMVLFGLNYATPSGFIHVLLSDFI